MGRFLSQKRALPILSDTSAQCVLRHSDWLQSPIGNRQQAIHAICSVQCALCEHIRTTQSHMANRTLSAKNTVTNFCAAPRKHVTVFLTRRAQLQCVCLMDLAPSCSLQIVLRDLVVRVLPHKCPLGPPVWAAFLAHLPLDQSSPNCLVQTGQSSPLDCVTAT